MRRFALYNCPRCRSTFADGIEERHGHERCDSAPGELVAGSAFIEYDVGDEVVVSEPMGTAVKHRGVHGRVVELDEFGSLTVEPQHGSPFTITPEECQPAGVAVFGGRPSLRDAERKLISAIVKAAVAHGAPNRFYFSELEAHYGGPWYLDAGFIAKHWPRDGLLVDGFRMRHAGNKKEPRIEVQKEG